jgi:hypothetical protein
MAKPLPNLLATKQVHHARKGHGERYRTPRQYPLKGGRRGNGHHDRKATTTLFAMNLDALKERRDELARQARETTAEWARMMRAGKKRTTSSVFATENERWR